MHDRPRDLIFFIERLGVVQEPVHELPALFEYLTGVQDLRLGSLKTKVKLLLESSKCRFDLLEN